MTRMTGGDAIVDSLLRYGVDTVFELPGVQMYGMFDAIAHNANRLKVINARHEQTTACRALGYRRHRQGLSTLRVPSTQTAIGEKGQVA
jgi:acetolactate synthase-1/2/3 large subunit